MAVQSNAISEPDAGADLGPDLTDWLCRMGDNTLILSHRLSEWCGHGPALEEDIALANLALDLIGHTQMWLGLAAEAEGQGRSADDLAALRDTLAFRNFLIVELPRGDMAMTIMRSFLFDVWHHAMLTALTTSSHGRVAEIAQKALKEVEYHLERSSDMVVRLGDGTAESHRRMQEALEILWPYTSEMFTCDKVDAAMAEAGIAPDPASLREGWERTVDQVLGEATLTLPPTPAYGQTGGKHGHHTEHLGHILSQLQFLQRAYPGASW